MERLVRGDDVNVRLRLEADQISSARPFALPKSGNGVPDAARDSKKSFFGGSVEKAAGLFLKEASQLRASALSNRTISLMPPP